jgi:hypothetical protein
MPNLSNVRAKLEGTVIRVTGDKGSSVTVRAYLNPDLTANPTNEALYDAYGQITTPKAEDSSAATSFDLSLPVGTTTQPYTVKVVSSDGKGDTPLIEATSIGIGRTSR